MQPDPTFLVIGAAAGCLGLFLIGRALRQRSRADVLKGLLWACFAAGLLVHGFAPNLKIERNRFIVPHEAVSGSVTPRDVVERERRMRLLSAVLVAGAALGLAFCYRGAFTSHGNDEPGTAPVSS